MKRGNQPQGYTIVEVLIFMAVSSLMFIMAAVFISGKQANVEFRQSLLEVNSRVQTVVNEVSNGEYAPIGSLKCSVPTTVTPPQYPSLSNIGGTGQGTNGDNLAGGATSGCTFIGKVIQFKVGGDGTKYNIYTMAGRILNTSENPVSSFADAMPIPIPASIERRTLNSGLEVTHVYFCQNSDCSVHPPSPEAVAVGLFGSFNTALGVATGVQQSGSQTITAANIPGIPTNQTEGDMISPIVATSLKAKTKDIALSDTLGNGKFILVCFSSGSKTGTLTIGGTNGQQFTTEVKTNGAFLYGAGHVC